MATFLDCRTHVFTDGILHPFHRNFKNFIYLVPNGRSRQQQQQQQQVLPPMNMFKEKQHKQPSLSAHSSLLFSCLLLSHLGDDEFRHRRHERHPQVYDAVVQKQRRKVGGRPDPGPVEVGVSVLRDPSGTPDHLKHNKETEHTISHTPDHLEHYNI